MYNPLNLSKNIAYMLQSAEYDVNNYFRWLRRNMAKPAKQYRGSLTRTKVSTFSRIGVMAVSLSIIITILVMIYIAVTKSSLFIAAIALLLFIAYPYIVGLAIVLPLYFVSKLLLPRKSQTQIKQATELFSRSGAIKIAVCGSYGKTSMKEMLGTVLSMQKNVAITVDNKNVVSEHLRFANKLTGQEEVLVVEFGEGGPGDVYRLSQMLKPDIAVITGIAPAHLDKYKSIEQITEDIFSVSDTAELVFVNSDSQYSQKSTKKTNVQYSQRGTNEISVQNVDCSVEGLMFRARSKRFEYKVSTKLLGRHHIGPICAVIAIAEQLNIEPDKIEKGLSKLEPHEHRMKPRELSSGAYIIDDTYNGNIDGIKAGLSLLKELSAKRKWYVTPGLVDQGAYTERVHVDIGEQIAQCAPDVVVLMKNSVAKYITKGLENGKYKGDLRIISDPYDFYLHIDNMLAAGDIALMQNDWPDNYS